MHGMGRWKQISRLFREDGFAQRAVRGRIYGFMRNRLGMAAPMLAEDRRVLEQVIIAHYCKDSHIRRVLFVGCDSYTAHYQGYFAAHDYWTMDPDAAVGRFGAEQHIIARLQDLGTYFSNGFFDLIICNGVFGWGLDSAEDCEAAVSQCHACLADAGHLLIGWNDVPERVSAPLAEVSSLCRFEKTPFPAFGTWQYLTNTPNRHTYSFYQKMTLNT
jgi:hypothetical protein